MVNVFYILRRRGLAGVAALIVMMLAAACGSDGHDGRTTEPSQAGQAGSSLPEDPPRHLDEDAYREAIAKIPVEGTDDVPFHWALPDIEDKHLADAVQAVRDDYALGYFRKSLTDKDEIRELAMSYVAVRTDEFLLSGYRAARSGEGNGLHGPVWFKILDAHALERTVGYAVTVCTDHRWRYAPGEKSSTPENVDKGVGADVRFSRDVGDGRYKVYVGRDATDDDKQECRRWAKDHKHGDS